MAENLLDDARDSLVRMQEFDPETLARETELGSLGNFREVVEPAGNLIELYKRLATSALEDFTDQILTQIRDKANEDLSRFTQILELKPSDENFQQQRTALTQQVAAAYKSTFPLLQPHISYSLYKSADFQRLDADARSTFQHIRNESKEITDQLEETKTEAERILGDIRKTAAERGVTQQAIYFKEEADSHQTKAGEWQRTTMWWALGVGIYAIASLFLHWFIEPKNLYETVQLAVSKVLIFGVLSFMLYLSARNFLSHQHNAILNKHRQNALLTYNALADAAGDTPNSEVILTHAAACIFSPQPTGYTRDLGSQAPSARSVVELFGRGLKPDGE